MRIRRTRSIGFTLLIVLVAALRYFDRTQQQKADQRASDMAAIVASNTLWLNVELVDFERDGLRGQMPQGWPEEENGTFVSPARDATFVVQRLPPVPLALVLPVVMQNLDVDSTPEAHAERQVNDITWTLYSTTADRKPVDFAIGQAAGSNVLLLLQSPRNQQAEFVEYVFLPMVDALEIIE